MEDIFKNIENDLIGLIGKDYVFTDKTTSVVYAKDIMPWDLKENNIPVAVVRPKDADEVSLILKYANEKKIPVHIHGSGTSLIGAARPKHKGILLDTARMKSLEIYPERGYYEMGVGLHVADARKVLKKHKVLLPIFPGSELVATVGGAVAVNTSAHAVDAALGKPGDYVLGLEVVLPNGEIITSGTESMRRPAGIEPTKFLIGSEGILCVYTKVRMRIIPEPYIINIITIHKKSEEILDRVMELYKRKLPAPLFFEYMDKKTSEISFEAVGLENPKGAVAIISVHSSTKEGCDKKAKIIMDFMNEINPIKVKKIENDEEWEKIWTSRSEAGNFLARFGASFGTEVTPRVDLLQKAYEDTKMALLNLDSCKNSEFYSYGHVGAPGIHPSAFFRDKNLDNDTIKKIYLEVRGKTEDLNIKYKGCGAEWGLTAQRVSFLKKKYPKAHYEMLKLIKNALDPNNILNRGNLEGLL